jgi:hypothetical protein
VKEPYDPFVIVEDGDVTNVPSLPVFNLRVLDEREREHYTDADVMALRDEVQAVRAILHSMTSPQARARLTQVMERCDEWLERSRQEQLAAERGS